MPSPSRDGILLELAGAPRQLEPVPRLAAFPKSVLGLGRLDEVLPSLAPSPPGAQGDRQKKKALRRSDAALLVKNLHYDTTEGELEALFGRYGSLLRLVLPPTKAVALVEARRDSLASNAHSLRKRPQTKPFGAAGREGRGGAAAPPPGGRGVGRAGGGFGGGRSTAGGWRTTWRASSGRRRTG